MHAESRPYPMSNGSEILIGTVRQTMHVRKSGTWTFLRLFILVVLAFQPDKAS